MTKSIPPKNIVLYADDDPDDRELVREALQNYSDAVEVVTVENGAEVLAYLHSLASFAPTPCLIILDVNMPLLNGKETLLRLRNMKRFSEVPVVLFTTSSQPQDRYFSQRHGAGFLTKPINLTQMSLIADQFIEHCTEEVKKTLRYRRSH